MFFYKASSAKFIKVFEIMFFVPKSSSLAYTFQEPVFKRCRSPNINEGSFLVSVNFVSRLDNSCSFFPLISFRLYIIFKSNFADDRYPLY